MTAFEPLRATDVQLLRQMLRRGALGEALEHQHKGRAGPATAFKPRTGKQIIDRSARGASIVPNRVAVSVVCRLLLGQGMPVGAVQALGMQALHQKVIARLLVEQAVEGKDQHRFLRLR